MIKLFWNRSICVIMLKTLREKVFVEIFRKNEETTIFSVKVNSRTLNIQTPRGTWSPVKSDVLQEFNYLHTKILAANYALQRNVIIAKKIAFLIPWNSFENPYSPFTSIFRNCYSRLIFQTESKIKTIKISECKLH